MGLLRYVLVWCCWHFSICCSGILLLCCYVCWFLGVAGLVFSPPYSFFSMFFLRNVLSSASSLFTIETVPLKHRDATEEATEVSEATEASQANEASEARQIAPHAQQPQVNPASNQHHCPDMPTTMERSVVKFNAHHTHELPAAPPSAPSSDGYIPSTQSSAALGCSNPPPPRVCLLPSMATRHPTLSLTPHLSRQPLRTWPQPNTPHLPLMSQLPPPLHQVHLWPSQGPQHQHPSQHLPSHHPQPLRLLLPLLLLSHNLTAPPARHDSRRTPSATQSAATYLPGWIVVVDVCVPHPLAAPAVAVVAWATGASANANNAMKRGMYWKALIVQ